MTSPIVPCLWFDDQAESAAEFYTETFPDGRILGTSHYPTSFDPPGGKPRGSLLSVEFEIAGLRFTALNGGPQFILQPSLSFFVHVATPRQADTVFARLAKDGEVLMPLDSYPWSERYGWVKDRFGVSWQVVTGTRTPQGATIVPCLMFSGPQQGRAEEALEVYTGIFPESDVFQLLRYAEQEGPEDSIKHARFTLMGQEMAATDSPLEHGFSFNEALSLQVMCDDQETLDRYWEALSEDGEQGPCGWLKDRFGVSWQVVPRRLSRWMSGSDSAAGDRAFKAMLGMGKLDIQTLEAAFQEKPGT